MLTQENWIGSVLRRVCKPLIQLYFFSCASCTLLLNPLSDGMTSAPIPTRGHAIYNGACLRMLLLPPGHPEQFQAPSRQMFRTHLLKDWNFSCQSGCWHFSLPEGLLCSKSRSSPPDMKSISLCRTSGNQYSGPVTPQDHSASGFSQAYHQPLLLINLSLSRV